MRESWGLLRNQRSLDVATPTGAANEGRKRERMLYQRYTCSWGTFPNFIQTIQMMPDGAKWRQETQKIVLTPSG